MEALPFSKVQSQDLVPNVEEFLDEGKSCPLPFRIPAYAEQCNMT